MTPEEQKELYKKAVQESIKEWMDEMYRTVGKWTLKGALVTIVAGLGYLYAFSHGWIIKP
jgi:hypothetical protein